MAPAETQKQLPARNLMVVGTDHRSSTMILRDRLYLDAGELPAFYVQLARAGLPEALVLSTIDRSEFYAVSDDPAGTDCGGR